MQTDETVTVGFEPRLLGRFIASDGTVLTVPDPNRPRLQAVAADGRLHGELLNIDNLLEADLSDDGRFAAVVDIGGQIRLWTWPDTLTSLGVTGRQVALSRDGSQLAFVSDSGQLQLCHTAACVPRQITQLPEAVQEFAWSGDGRVLCVASTGGRVLRLDLASGSTAQWLEFMPSTKPPNGFPMLAAGSTYRFAGQFAPGASYLRHGSEWIAALDSSATTVTAQIPWTQPPSDQPVYIGGPHPFETIVGVGVRATAPRVLALAHDDFSPFDPSQDIARPGEVIHFFLQGLGPPAEPLADGQAAPIDRLISLRLPWQFARAVAGSSEPLETVFLGMAPGLIGVYQADIRMPLSAPDGLLNIMCQLDGAGPSLAVIRLR